MRIDQFVMSKDMVECLVDILLLVAADGSILDANDAALSRYGYSHTQMLTMNIRDVRGPNYEIHCFEQTGGADVTGVMFETDNICADGTVFPVVVWRAPVTVEGESATLELVHDITLRKQADDEVRFRNTILSTVQESSLDGILVVDKSGCILSHNRRFVEMWNVPEELMTSGDDGPLLAFNASQLRDPESFIEHVRNLYESSVESSRDELLLADGRVFDRYSSPMLGSNGEHYGRVWYFRDITDRRRMEQTLVDALASVTDVIGAVSEMRDPYTAGHQRRVAELSVAIARDLGMEDKDISDLRIAALLHDIGKMSVPTEILTKPGALSPLEFMLIHEHSESGFSILTSAHVPEPIPEIVHQHHERNDGSGYPRGLMGEDLLDASKILMVADVVEAMASHRPYRPKLGIDAAIAEIEAGAGTLYDSRVVESCVRVVRAPGFSFWDAPAGQAVND
ncbi:MAG: HD domain-containing protein [Coriobacteriia bacterium]|nr:HD domain-containing protein [Coriobacteriia bacterium]